MIIIAIFDETVYTYQDYTITTACGGFNEDSGVIKSKKDNLF